MENCAICKKEITKNPNGGIGYGYRYNNRTEKICYECCGDIDRKGLEDLKQGGKYILYMNTAKKYLSNWPGTFKIELSYIKEGRHNIAGKRFDTWFNFQGSKYHAVLYGTNTEVAHVKKLKP